MTRKVRFCLPRVICRARAWTISGLERKRWKLVKTRIAELSALARALIERMAASGSLPPASAVALFWPGICNPCSMSHVASRQFCSRHSWAISRRASSCSWDSIHRPVKQAEMYSVRRWVSDMEKTSW